MLVREDTYPEPSACEAGLIKSTCECRSEKNVPAQQLNVIDDIDLDEKCLQDLKCGILCLQAAITASTD